MAQFLNASVGGISLGLIWGVLAVGVYLTYRILDFADLTVDSSLATGGVVTAVLIANGCTPILALLASCLAGSCAGLITALLNTKLKIPAILAGILTMSALYSINLKILGNRANVSFVGKPTINGYWADLFNLSLIDDKNVLSIITCVIVCSAVVGFLYWFFGTEFGCSVRATGFNSTMAKAQGINTDLTKIVCLMISNGLAGLAGGLLAQHNQSGDVNMGTGTIVIGLASVILAETVIRDRFSFWLKLALVVLGSVAYRLIFTFAVQMGMHTNDLKLVATAIIVIALTVPLIKKKIAHKKLKGGLNNVKN